MAGRAPAVKVNGLPAQLQHQRALAVGGRQVLQHAETTQLGRQVDARAVAADVVGQLDRARVLRVWVFRREVTW